VTYDYYPRDWHKHTDTEWVLEGLYRHFRDHAAPGIAIQKLEDGEPNKRGDLLAFALTRRKVSNHAAVYLGPIRGQGPHVLHCNQGRGVNLFPYHGFFARMKTHAFRVMQVN
jgi:cell wall-associated NlpC family hydrolase